VSAVRSEEEFQRLLARGVIPASSPFRRESLQAAACNPADRTRGALAECTPYLLQGSVRSSFYGDTPSIVVALSSMSDGPFEPVGFAWPTFLEADRNATFTMQLQKPFPEGARIRLVSINPRSGHCWSVGTQLRVRNGKVIKESLP
jgi:hypothetical protein